MENVFVTALCIFWLAWISLFLCGLAVNTDAPPWRFDLILWDVLTFLRNKKKYRGFDSPMTNAEVLFRENKHLGYDRLYRTCDLWYENIEADWTRYGYSDRVRAKRYKEEVQTYLRHLFIAEDIHRQRCFSANGYSYPRQRPAPPTPSWRKTLGLPPQERNPKIIKTTARRLIQKAHPDAGGGGNVQIYIQALDEARKELGFV